jgi:hypothetical protein
MTLESCTIISNAVAEMPVRNQIRGPAYVRQRPDYSESLREQAAWQAEVRHGESVRWRIRGQGRTTPHLNPLLERGGEEGDCDGHRHSARLALLGLQSTPPLKSSLNASTERGGYRPRGSASLFHRFGSDPGQSCHEQCALNRVGQVFGGGSPPVMEK